MGLAMANIKAASIFLSTFLLNHHNINSNKTEGGAGEGREGLSPGPRLDEGLEKVKKGQWTDSTDHTKFV